MSGYVPLSVREGDWRRKLGWHAKGCRERAALWLAPWLHSNSQSAYERGYQAALVQVQIGEAREHFKKHPAAKRAFATESEARAFLIRTGQSDRFRFYQCGLCGEWHFATRRDGSWSR